MSQMHAETLCRSTAVANYHCFTGENESYNGHRLFQKADFTASVQFHQERAGSLVRMANETYK